MNLTPHFSLEEIVASEYAARRGISNNPDSHTLVNLRVLAQGLERVREIVARPIIITSGYRSAEVNRGVGGSRGSAHVQGLAADIRVQGYSANVLAKIIRDSVDVVQYDKLIDEFGQWVHISFPEIGGQPKCLELTATHTGAGVVYSEGLS